MALQRVAGNAAPAQGPSQPPAAGPAAVNNGPALSTRETTSRPFVELGVMFGQALGGREPVMQALTNLQNVGQEHGCDAILAVKLLHYPTTAGPAVVAYGTGVRFLPAGSGAAPGTPGGAPGAPDNQPPPAPAPGSTGGQ